MLGYVWVTIPVDLRSESNAKYGRLPGTTSDIVDLALSELYWGLAICPTLHNLVRCDHDLERITLGGTTSLCVGRVLAAGRTHCIKDFGII